MPALQVKDCPVSVYEQLRACADEENRSIAQQTLTIIQDFLAARERDTALGETSQRAVRPPYSAETDEVDYVAKRKRAFERISALPPIPVSATTPAAADVLAQIRQEEAR